MNQSEHSTEFKQLSKKLDEAIAMRKMLYTAIAALGGIVLTIVAYWMQNVDGRVRTLEIEAATRDQKILGVTELMQRMDTKLESILKRL